MVLKAKIITITALVITLSIAVSMSIVLKVQRDRMMQKEIQNIESLSRIIIRSIESAMIDNRSKDVQKILTNIGRGDNIQSLRIISTDGNILTSKDPSEIGSRSKVFQSSRFTGNHFKTRIEKNSITHLTRIRNKPRCYGCHSKDIKTNGIIEIDYDISGFNTDMLSLTRLFLMANVVTVLIVTVILSMLFSKFILMPLKTLLGTINRVESGDWDASVDIKSTDELGTIGRSFNKMIGEIRKLYDKNIKKEREISRARIELDHKRKVEELNSQLQFKIKEVETANKAVLSLSKEVKSKNIELEKIVDRLKKINKIGRFLSSIIETEELIKLIIKTTSQLLTAKKGSIHLRKDDATKLTLQYREGMGIENLSHISLEFHPLYKQILSDGKPILVTKGGNGGGTGPGSNKEQTTAAGVPLKMKGRVIGGMLLEDKSDGTEFSEDEIDLLTTMANQAMVAVENAWLYESVKSNYFGTIQALVNALEANDRYTRGHSERVRFLSIELAKRLGMDVKELEVIEHAAILHDIGKIGIDSVILNKSGKLSSTEFSLIKAHPLIGDEILGPIGTLEGVRTTILQHHERYDGKGYPYGIAGEEISLKARILSVIDTFDAMLTDRPYRKALGLDFAREEIRTNANTQFDPVVCDEFLEMIEGDNPEVVQMAGYVIP